jgi:WbqC-like protein family
MPARAKGRPRRGGDHRVTLGVMQPYLLPYIGYWQLLAAVDRFVLYDNIQYAKKGWINRNRFLRNGADAFFTVPLKKGSDFLNVVDRTIADDFDPDTLLQPLAGAYRKAPFFSAAFPVIEAIVDAAPRNLFEYLHQSIVAIADYLEIGTPIVVSSTVPIDHGLKGERKVLALCQALGATRYLNASGGRELYSAPAFAEQGIELKFIQPRPIVYRQYDHPFVPALSIVDVMMFNSREAVRGMLGEYDLV